MSRPVVTVVVHHEKTRLGWLAAYLEQHWGQLQVLRSFADELPDPATLSGPVVVMGGVMGVADIPHLPWLAREVEWIGQVVRANHPYLGICLGGQLMAHALGHTVKGCEEGTMECGYYPTHVSTLPSHVYHWHQDGIYVTDQGCGDVECLGASAWKQGRTTQAIARFRALGTQFHPEVDPITIQQWLAADPAHTTLPCARPADTHLADHARYGAGQADWLAARLGQMWY